MSNRKITKEQFTDGTTIDGTRIEKALDDVATRFNNVEKGDLEKRFVQTQYVMGCMPVVRDEDGKLDRNARQVVLQWLNTTNDLRNGTMGMLVDNEDRTYTNRYRVKGFGTEDGVMWSTPLIFKEPVIVKDIHVFFITDFHDFGTDSYAIFNEKEAWNQDTSTPYNPLKQTDILLHVDSPYQSEQRAYNLKELCRHDFEEQAYTINRYQQYPDFAGKGRVEFNDMLPLFPRTTNNSSANQTPINGSAFNLSDINTPIPRDSRVRLSIKPSGALGSTPPPWSTQYYSVVITIYEEIIE